MLYALIFTDAFCYIYTKYEVFATDPAAFFYPLRIGDGYAEFVVWRRHI